MFSLVNSADLMASATHVVGFISKMSTNLFCFSGSTVISLDGMVNIIQQWIREDGKSEDDKVLRSSQC